MNYVKNIKIVKHIHLILSMNQHLIFFKKKLFNLPLDQIEIRG